MGLKSIGLVYRTEVRVRPIIGLELGLGLFRVGLGIRARARARARVIGLGPNCASGDQGQPIMMAFWL